MFGVRLSCVPALQLVAQRCRLPYISFVREIDGAGDLLCGLELELPPLIPREVARHFFFWPLPDDEFSNPYEDVALQGLRFLQAIYGFVVVDYSYTEVSLYRHLAAQIFSVANRGAHLARCVVTESEYGFPGRPYVLAAADDLLSTVDSIRNPQQ
jgi:hypothetical protein